MENAKLFIFLRTFAARDLRRFREFLESPFHNKREDLRQFYQTLQPWAPDFSGESLTRQAVWEAYAPDRNLDDKELTYLMNFLLQQAENYIAVEAFCGDATAMDNQVISYCLDQGFENGLEKHYRSLSRRTRRALEAEPYRDAEWHLKAWRLADAGMQQFYLSRARTADDSISRVVEHLDAFYLDKKLELSSEILNRNHILQEEHDTGFIPDLMEMADALDAKQPLVRIRKLIVNILLDPTDTDSFIALRSLLSVAAESYPPDSVKGIFAYAQNHCIRRIKAGDTRFEQELLGIFRMSLKAGVIYENDWLSPWNFKNICSIGLKLGEYDWVETFIADQRSRIAPRFRDTALAYNRANLAFHQGQFDRALRALREVEFSDIFYALDTRRMMLMIYYERGDAAALSSLLASFRTFLRRNRVISEQNRQAYKHFVDWVARLFRMHPDDPAREVIEVEIGDTHPLVEREWLLRQAK